MGVLIKGGETLQALADVRTIVFDKTGTLTEGKPAVTDIVPAAGVVADDFLRIVASLEQSSEHPLAAAIVVEAQRKKLALAEATNFEAKPGRGVVGRIGNDQVAVGNPALMTELGVDSASLADAVHRFASEGKTAMLAAIGGKLAGVIAVADPIKTTAKSAIDRLRAMGLDVELLTGDNVKTANAIAQQLGVARVTAEVLPAGKVEAIKKLQGEGRSAAMVGDGINDAPALAQANVGIALATGTDIAVEAGDVTLMRGDPNAAVDAVALAKQTMRVMKENLFWAFGYNVIGIPIAAGVLYPAFGILLSPVLASAAMAFSSVSVVTNSLRLRSFHVNTH